MPQTVKIGISMPLPPEPPAVTVDPATYAREAERIGFESFWVGEHAVSPVHVASYSPVFHKGQVPGFLDPFAALARASAATSTIRLGTAVTLVPEHHPIVLAKQIATLDQYSDGRFLFGVGSGWMKEETAIMGGDPDRPWAQTKEAVLAMKALWTEDVAEFHGHYFDYPPARCFPKPAQRPHPPILIGGGSRHVFKRVASYGDGWLPHRTSPRRIRQGRDAIIALATEMGRDPSSLTITYRGDEPNLEKILEYHEAGAERVILRPAQITEEHEILPELERIARLVLV